MTENELSRVIVDAALEVHRRLGGPGLLESVYEEALAAELESRGVSVRRQVPVVLTYKGRELRVGLRLDLLVGELVIVECKVLVAYNSICEAQALTYLRLADYRLALVINFGEKQVRKGLTES
jgi:GxxExxY protein